jgi:hypothetical protein
MGTVTTEATLDLGPSKLDIAKYRDIWFKTSFLLDQSKNGMAQARFDNYKTKLNYTFPTHFTGKNQLSMLRNHVQKRRLSVKKVTQNAKWQMPCILPVLM